MSAFIKNPDGTERVPGAQDIADFKAAFNITDQFTPEQVTQLLALIQPTPIPAPVINTVPTLFSSVVGSPITWSNGSATGAAEVGYSLRNQAGTELASTSGVYTPTAAGALLTVFMTAVGEDGQTATGQSNTVTVTTNVPVINVPVANFTASSTSGAIPLTVNFTDTSTNTPDGWEWEFFGAGLVQSTEKNPSYTFREPGTYTVKLRARNSSGQNEVVKTGLITVTDKTYTARGATISRYTEGAEDVMYKPTAERIVESGGAQVFDFTAVEPTTINNAVTDLYAPTRWAPQSNSRRLVSQAAGGFSAVFPVAAFPVYDATKNLVFKYYASDFQPDNVQIKIDNGSFNSQTWQLSGTGFKRGWNLIVLGAPDNATARALYSSHVNVSWISTAQGNPVGMNGRQIKNITVSFSGQAAKMPVGSVVHLCDLQTGTVVKPILGFTFDQTAEGFEGKSIFREIIIPMFAKYGLVGDARATGQQAENSVGLQLALAAGWGYTNGTENRIVPTVTTRAQVLSEYGNVNSRMSAAAYPVSLFGAQPGHNTGLDAPITTAALLELGAPKYMRGNAQRYVYHGVQGCPNRAQTFGVYDVDGETSFANAQKYIDGMIAAGGYGCFFSHTASWSAAEGANFEQILAYIRQKVDAGQIDFVPFGGKLNGRTMERAYEGYI